ncbi:5-oxoprolinase subunit PxpA [uncultured Croceitalea sp.]|uniref:5-oxoprolinase subunit PxpA n=1 Tax=uncultured Croceitalea sp. TaxID=1798908 RepID=UPI00374E6F7C
MKLKSIDINCDVGEGIGNESRLFPLISSCNIACGGHAGTKKTILEIALLAKKNNVKVGAHPSYPDKNNFGRVVLDMSKKELCESIKYQLKTFQQVISLKGVKIHHIKPHGALYNQIAIDIEVADTFLKAISQYKDKVFLYVPYNSVIEREAKKKGFKIIYEAFCDRNYNNDLTLVSRSKNKALITRPKAVLDHVLQMLKKQTVKTISGESRKIFADTFCIHGDSTNAIEILTYLSTELPKNGIRISK